MIKKIVNKNIQYNLLSLLNVFIGFIFIVYLGRKFGAGEQTDIYFLSIVVISYLGYFVQSVWEAMSPYYVEQKLKDKEELSKFYSVLLNNLVFVALFIVFIYFIITSFFEIVKPEQKEFLDVFIFYLIFQNILFLNKAILLLEHFYASFYVVDIFVYIGLFLSVYMYDDILHVAYATLIFTIFANMWQFYLVFQKVGITYRFIFFKSDIKEIYKNSFKLKLGSLFYGIKDIIIASVFTSFGAGTYSLYSYANKFAGVILQVVNSPIVNIFATKANYMIANKEYNKLKESIKKVLTQTISLFVVSATFTYFILPHLLTILFQDKFTQSDIYTIQEIFLVMSIYGLMMILESPFGRVLYILKQFNFSIKLNIFYGTYVALSFSLLYYIFTVKNIVNYLYVLIIIHTIVGVIIIKKFRRFV